MFGRKSRKHRRLPTRPCGEPLRDGDTVLYPGYPRAADVLGDATAPLAAPAWPAWPAWAGEPTQPQQHVEAPSLVRRYALRHVRGGL